MCQGVQTGGRWFQLEQKLHINCLQLLAGSFAVKSFTKDQLCAHVRLPMDNIAPFLSHSALTSKIEGTYKGAS